jgi:hypothetical protein
LESVHHSARTSDEALLFLERAFLVAQERVREQSMEDTILLTGGMLCQIQSPTSSSSDQPTNSQPPTNSTTKEKEWVYLCINMPGGPMSCLIHNNSKDMEIEATSDFSVNSSPISTPSLIVYHPQGLSRSATLCRTGDLIAVINSEVASLFDPEYLNKSPSNYSSWSEVPDPVQKKKECVLHEILRTWQKSAKQIDLFVDNLIHKVVTNQKERVTITSESAACMFYLFSIVSFPL